MDVAGEFNYEDKDDMIKIVTREVDKYDFLRIVILKIGI